MPERPANATPTNQLPGRQMGEHHYGQEQRESAEDKAARMVAAGLKEAGWQEADLALRRKGDPVKLALARRLRRETTLPLKWICHRLEMGSWKSIQRRLYEQEQTKGGHARNPLYEKESYRAMKSKQPFVSFVCWTVFIFALLVATNLIEHKVSIAVGSHLSSDYARWTADSHKSRDVIRAKDPDGWRYVTWRVGFCIFAIYGITASIIAGCTVWSSRPPFSASRRKLLRHAPAPSLAKAESGGDWLARRQPGRPGRSRSPIRLHRDTGVPMSRNSLQDPFI
jgi:hypothetical protein